MFSDRAFSSMRRGLLCCLFSWLCALCPSLSQASPIAEPCDSATQSCNKDAPFDAGQEAPIDGLIAEPNLQVELSRHLKRPIYRFCQDPKYRLYQDDKKALCPHVDALEKHCPELKAACQRPSWEEGVKSQERPTDPFWEFDGVWIAFIIKAAFWTFLAIGVGLLLRALLRHLHLYQQEENETNASDLHAALSTSHEEEDLPPDALLALATHHLGEARIHEALHLIYRATISSLSQSGWLQPHRSKTSGDYLRALRKKSPRRVPSGEVASSNLTENDESLDELEVLNSHLSALDRERFCRLPHAEKARALLKQAEALSRRLGTLGACLLSLSFSACGDGSGTMEAPSAPGAPQGHELFFDLLKERADSVSKRVQFQKELSNDTGTVIALAAHLDRADWKRLNDWVQGGGHLVVAAPGPSFEESFHLDLRIEECSEALSAPKLSLVELSTTRYFSDKLRFERLAECGNHPVALTSAWGEGWLSLVADAHLFENASLALKDNASLALHIVGATEGHVELLGPWTGGGASSPLKSVANAGFGIWLLHLLVLGMLYAWAAGKRFGTPTEPEETKRRAFSEHALALSRMYQRSHASGWVLQNYAEWVYDCLRRRVPSSRADLRSLSRALCSSDKKAAALRKSLTLARRQSELGESSSEHQANFRMLQDTLLRTAERPRSTATKQKD